jgi:hypothetical protein
MTVIGCSHKTVEPEVEPGQKPDFETPESTLATLTEAVKFRNTANYGMCFADTAVEQREFHATFDSADAAQYVALGGHVPASWVRSSELTFFPGFVSYAAGAPYRCSFALDDDLGGIIDFGGPTQLKVYNLRYRVWSGSTAVAAGAARISLERVGATGEYRLTRWEDHRDTLGVRTWGMARLLGG